METVGIILIVLAVLLFVANRYIERQRKALGEDAPPRRGRGKRLPEPAEEEPDFVRPRPQVAEFHVRGEEAQVTFAVPYPDEGDDILADLLVSEAIEVVREKRHTLPIDDVTQVVVKAGGDGREVGRMSLVTPGVLPPPSRMTDILNLRSIGTDPLAAEFDLEPSATIPETVAPPTSDDLAPVGETVRLPKAVATGLRAQGIDPETMDGGQLVTGVLSLFGYTIMPGPTAGEYTATKGGATTFIMTDPYREGDYPEVSDETIRRFVVAFEQSKANRGMLVSEKFGPFSIHDMERRNPRVRFVTRERLQKLVDSMALG